MTDIATTPDAGAGARSAPPELWARAKQQYLRGLSAAEVCREFGLRKSTFFARAGAEGWRRSDQPESDEFIAFDGPLDDADGTDMVLMARARLAKALVCGRAADARSWMRVYVDLRDASSADDTF